MSHQQPYRLHPHVPRIETRVSPFNIFILNENFKQSELNSIYMHASPIGRRNKNQTIHTRNSGILLSNENEDESLPYLPQRKEKKWGRSQKKKKKEERKRTEGQLSLWNPVFEVRLRSETLIALDTWCRAPGCIWVNRVSGEIAATTTHNGLNTAVRNRNIISR